PMIIFGSGREFSQLRQPRYSNFSYAGSEVMRVANTTNLYLNRDSQSLLPHAANIAITQGVLSEGGHTSLFNYREGGSGKGRTTQIVELAHANTTQAIVKGVQWPGSVTNKINDLQNLSPVTSTSFVDLFKAKTLRLSSGEVNTILQAAQKLSRRQALMLEAHMNDSLSHYTGYQKALHMVQTDASQLLDTSLLPNTLKKTGSYGTYQETLGLTLKAFEGNLINSSLITMELGDWHGYQNNKQNSSIVKAISEMLAATIQHLKNTPDLVAGPGKTLWDTTLIAAGSEFNRGIAPFSKDNNDGGTQGLMLIGKNIKGNYYGGFQLHDDSRTTNGEAFGFDPETGAPTPSMKNTTEQLYYTLKAALGLELGVTERTKVLKTMLGAA
ncbi:hypothetical protein GW916_02590, partial [bacterium]|nr:hypothetical protein [bacterium]